MWILGPINDRGIFLVNGEALATIEDSSENFAFNLSQHLLPDKHREYNLDVLVENLGRLKYGTELDSQHKGINSTILLDQKAASEYHIYSLDFNQEFLEKLIYSSDWTPIGRQTQPTLYRTTLEISEPADTFLELPGWTKGNVFLNGFNLGRYYNVGPQKTLYIPGPLLKKGANTILIFELHSSGKEIRFIDHPVLE